MFVENLNIVHCSGNAMITGNRDSMHENIHTTFVNASFINCQ